MRTFPAYYVMLLVVGLITSHSFAIVIGQFDDFQDGTTMNWSEGAVSPNLPTNNTDGGPGGVGDHSLQNVASGFGGAGAKMVMFNNLQWTGDYLDAGVSSISALMKADPAGSSLLMRIAIEGNPGQRWASANAINLPNDGLWHAVSFDLNAADLVQVAGADPLGIVLSNVTELRILHSTAPNWHGGEIPATLDVDTVTAIPEPTTLALLTLGSFVIARRKRQSVR